MNILFVCYDHNLSGANMSLLDLLEDYDKNECNITVMLPKSCTEFENKLKQLNVKVLVCKFVVSIGKIRKGIYTFAKNTAKYFAEKLLKNSRVKKAIKSLDNEKFDCVISNSFATLFGYYVAKKLNVRHYFYIREFMNEDHKIKHLFNVSEICKDSYAIYISKSIEKYFNKKYKFIDSMQVYDKVNLNLDNIKLKELNKDNINICMVGSLHEGKGQQDIIQAVSILEKQGYNIKLSIAGSGLRLEYLQNLSNSLNLKNCKFLGQVKNMKEIYDSSDISTICSRQEALGRVTVESLANGLYVVGTNSGETEYLLSENRGLFYSFGNYEELAEKIKQIIETKGSNIDRNRNINYIRENFEKPILPLILDFIEKG